jgi:hypothetical protein
MSDEICYRQKRTSNAAPGGIEELVNAIGLGSHAAGQHELKDQVIETSIPMKYLEQFPLLDSHRDTSCKRTGHSRSILSVS